MRKLTTFSVVIAITMFGFAGLVMSIGSADARSGRDNVFRGRWLSAVAPLLEARGGYCLGFSSAPVDLTDFDDDGDGVIDEDPFDGVDNDNDGLVDEDIIGLGNRGRIYMTHGFTNADTADVRVYDTQNNVWLDDSGNAPNLLPAAPASASVRSEGVGVAHGGLVYCLGGRTGGAALNLVEAYDPTANGWTALTSMNTDRSGLAAAVVGSRIYTAGGRSDLEGPCSGSPLNVAEVYDIPSDTWADITPPPTPVTDASAIAHGGKVFLIGGCKAANPSGVTNDVQIYDRNTDTWSPGAPMTTPRASLALGILGNTIYAIGGIDGSDFNLDVVEAYDIDKNAWTSPLTSKPTAASEIQGVSHGGKIFVPGSGPIGSPSSVFEVFRKK